MNTILQQLLSQSSNQNKDENQKSFFLVLDITMPMICIDLNPLQDQNEKLVKLVISQRCSVFTLKHLLKIIFKKTEIHFSHKDAEQNADKLNEKEHQMCEMGMV